MPRLSKLIYIVFLIISDISALFVSFFAGFFIRTEILPKFFSPLKVPPLPFDTQLRYGLLYAAIFVVLVLMYEKLYTKRFSFWDETKYLLTGVTFSFILLMTIVFVSRGYQQFSRIVILIAWIFCLFLFPIFRLVIRKILFSIRALRKKVLILGTSQTAKLIATEIEKNWSLGYEIIGFLNTGDDDPEESVLNGLPVLGKTDQIGELSQTLGIQDFVISSHGINQDRLLEIVENCEKVADTIRIVPDIGNLFTMGIAIENWGDILFLSIARNLVKPWNIFIKNIIEFFTTLVLSILLLPLFLFIAIAIKIDSRGSILYLQERLSWKNKTFKCFKFRSMYIDGDFRLKEFLQENQMAKEEWKKYRKLKKNDPRVTRVGRFIRKYSLDELPQLINVLKGDMSLVGPRPYMPREKEDIGKSYPIISRVKPGITGLWQVRGRNILTFEDRLLLDEYYIRNWSLWLDIVILFKTIKVLMTQEGAY